MQGDDSKEGRDSKRLSRAELLEMLIEQSKEVDQGQYLLCICFR